MYLINERGDDQLRVGGLRHLGSAERTGLVSQS